MIMYCKCVDYFEFFVYCKYIIIYWSYRIFNFRNVYLLIIYEKVRFGLKKIKENEYIGNFISN